MSVVWEMELKPAEKLVLLALADNANDEGVCWPSIRTICRKSCLGESTVHRAIGKLKELGMLYVNGNDGHSNNFNVLPGRIEGVSIWHPPVTPPLTVTPPPVSPRHPRGVTLAPRIIKESSIEPSEIFRKLLKTSGKEPARTERIQKAIDKIGGWPKIRNCTEFDLHQAEKAFVEAYS